MSEVMCTVHTLGVLLQRLAGQPRLREEVDQAVEILGESTDGKVITVGMGKAGIIARKFSATLSSVGIPSFFLHPGEAAHGDLGAISSWDAVVVMSTSGRTEEVHKFIRQASDLANPVIMAITSFPGRLPAERIDHFIELPEIQEADPFNLVPTMSTSVLLAICDEIAVRLMEYKKFTAADFAARHHGGYLGQKARKAK